MSTISISPNQVLEQLHWRYATKKFDAHKKISEPIWQSLLEALVLTPSSFGLQPWKFFVITNLDIRQQLVEHSWGQRQVVDASHLLVLSIKAKITELDVDKFIEYTAQIRNIDPENLAGYSKVIKGFIGNPNFDSAAWATKQVYIALGQFMTAAALLGIDTCPMEGFNPTKYDELLGISEKGYHSVLVCPAGFRAEDDKNASYAKSRFPIEQVVEYI
jgi:nitroreductase